MYHSFEIKNFRCFKDLKIGPFQRINLIAGRNNVGKTSLLEAVFLHVGWNNAKLPEEINEVRGVEKNGFSAEQLWGWLFFEKETKETISLIGNAESGHSGCLRIHLGNAPLGETADRSKKTSVTAKERPSLTTAVEPSALILDHEDSSGQQRLSWAYLAAQGEIRYVSDMNDAPTFGIYISESSHSFSAQENAERFSRIREIGRQDEVVEALRRLEPRLQDLSILVTGGTSTVCGDIGIGKLVPVPFMGEGMARLLTIVLAILSAKDGVVLVDEVENGLHYSSVVNVWKTVAQAARSSNTQVFATTHSWECICAAHEAFSSDEMYDFALHRLDRSKDSIRAVTYDQESLDGAIHAGLEVR